MSLFTPTEYLNLDLWSGFFFRTNKKLLSGTFIYSTFYLPGPSGKPHTTFRPFRARSTEKRDKYDAKNGHRNRQVCLYKPGNTKSEKASKVVVSLVNGKVHDRPSVTREAFIFLCYFPPPPAASSSSAHRHCSVGHRAPGKLLVPRYHFHTDNSLRTLQAIEFFPQVLGASLRYLVKSEIPQDKHPLEQGTPRIHMQYSRSPTDKNISQRTPDTTPVYCVLYILKYI